jgi:hypothetical protein
MSTTSPAIWFGQDRRDRGLLALEDARRAGERWFRSSASSTPGGLDDAAVLGDVAVEHREPAVLE